MRTELRGSKPATIHEVAALAGVSHQTVSRFLKADPGMRATTVERVKTAMAQLHYSPNLAARALRTGALYRIVVIAPEATLYFPTRLLNGAAAVAHRNGYRVDVLALEGTAAERESGLRTILADNDLAGVLAFTPLPLSPRALAELAARTPVLVAGEYDAKMRASGALANGAAAGDIVEHLVGHGHRHFFHVAGPAAWPSARNRQAAYEAAVDRLGVTSHGTAAGDWSADSGYRAATELLRHRQVTAVVVANDQMAFGVLRALHEAGVAVPGAMSVFGWDDMAEGRFFVPSLSTVHADQEGQGAALMGELLNRITGAPLPVDGAPLPAMELIPRESSGPAPALA